MMKRPAPVASHSIPAVHKSLLHAHGTRSCGKCTGHPFGRIIILLVVVALIVAGIVTGVVEWQQNSSSSNDVYTLPRNTSSSSTGAPQPSLSSSQPRGGASVTSSSNNNQPVTVPSPFYNWPLQSDYVDIGHGSDGYVYTSAVSSPQPTFSAGSSGKYAWTSLPTFCSAGDATCYSASTYGISTFAPSMPQSYTKCVWANYGSYPGYVSQLISGIITPGSNSAHALFVDSSSILHLDHGNQVAISSQCTAPVPTYINQWVHFCGSWDDSSKVCSLYANGVRLTSTVGSSTSGWDGSSASVYVGRGDIGYAFNGQLTQAQIWDRALTSAQVASQFAASTFAYSNTHTSTLVQSSQFEYSSLYYLVQGGQCLGIPLVNGDSYNTDTQVTFVLMPCKEGYLNQQFVFQPDNSLRLPAAPGKGANLNGGCSTNLPLQQFTVNSPPAPNSMVVYSTSAKTLSVCNGQVCIEMSNGQAVSKTCSGSAAQQWTLSKYQ